MSALPVSCPMCGGPVVKVDDRVGECFDCRKTYETNPGPTEHKRKE